MKNAGGKEKKDKKKKLSRGETNREGRQKKQ